MMMMTMMRTTTAITPGLALLFAMGLLTTACGKSQISDPASTRPASNVVVSEDSATQTTGTFTKDASGDQTLVVQGNPALRDSAITVPPGALSLSTPITLAEGADQKAALTGALGITNNAVVGGTTPLTVTPGDATASLTAPMTITLPLPITKDNLSTSAKLASGKLVALYLYKKASGGYRAGLKVLTSSDFQGTFAKLTSPGFGWFIVVYFAGAVEDKEVDVDFGPLSK